MNITQEESFGAARLTVQGGWATLWLSRPDVGNAINIELVSSVQRALDAVEDRAAELPPVLVLRGAGRDFSRGIDLKDFPTDKAPDIHGFNRWERVVRQLERLPLATVAAVEGACLGGGLQLALAADLRVVAEGARLAFTEVGQGFLPGMSTWRIAKLVGLARARSLVLTGRAIGAAEASAMGLADGLAPAGGLSEAVAAFVEGLGPVRQPAWSLARRLMIESYEFSYEDAIGHFLAAQHRAITSETFTRLLDEEGR